MQTQNDQVIPSWFQKHHMEERKKCNEDFKALDKVILFLLVSTPTDL